MRTTRFLRACRVQANAWLRGGFQKSGRIESDTKTQAVCKPWVELRRDCFKAGCTPKRIADWAASKRCARPCSSLPGKRPKVSLGPGTIINENALKAKAIR